MSKEIEYRNDFVGNFRLLSFATGSYSNICRLCGKPFIGDKLALSCLACAIKAAEETFSNAHKQDMQCGSCTIICDKRGGSVCPQDPIRS